MKGKTPNKESGKTRYNRGKKKGQSWTALRDADRNNKQVKE